MKKILLLTVIALSIGLLACNSNSDKEVKTDTQPSDQKTIASHEDFSENIVEAIKSKDAEQYFQLYPNAEKVAKYGIITYGMTGGEEELKLRLQAWPAFIKSIDSIGAIKKPATIAAITHLMDDFHKTINWKEVSIVKADTIGNINGVMADGEMRNNVQTLTSNLKIYIKTPEGNYRIVCPDILWIEGERWFLRARYTDIRLEKE